MSPDKLIYMANQIGKFFAAQDRDDGARAWEGIATHLRRFWDPRMRNEIIAKVEAGEARGPRSAAAARGGAAGRRQLSRHIVHSTADGSKD